MSNKNSVIHGILKSPMRSYASDNTKLNTNANKKTNNVSYRQKNKYHLINSNSVQKGNVINPLETDINKDKINKLKSYLPYIPNKERQKAEDNFIDLILKKILFKIFLLKIMGMKDIDREVMDILNI